jgi:hypothetical protein
VLRTVKCHVFNVNPVSVFTWNLVFGVDNALMSLVYHEYEMKRVQRSSV